MVWNSSVFIDFQVISNIYATIYNFGQQFSTVELGTTDHVVAASKLNRLYSFFTKTALCCAMPLCKQRGIQVKRKLDALGMLRLLLSRSRSYMHPVHSPKDIALF